MIFEDEKIDDLIAQRRLAEASAALVITQAEGPVRAAVYAIAGDDRGLARVVAAELLGMPNQRGSGGVLRCNEPRAGRLRSSGCRNRARVVRRRRRGERLPPSRLRRCTLGRPLSSCRCSTRASGSPRVALWRPRAPRTPRSEMRPHWRKPTASRIGCCILSRRPHDSHSMPATSIAPRKCSPAAKPLPARRKSLPFSQLPARNSP